MCLTGDTRRQSRITGALERSSEPTATIRGHDRPVAGGPGVDGHAGRGAVDLGQLALPRMVGIDPGRAVPVAGSTTHPADAGGGLVHGPVGPEELRRAGTTRA